MYKFTDGLRVVVETKRTSAELVYVEEDEVNEALEERIVMADESLLVTRWPLPDSVRCRVG